MRSLFVLRYDMKINAKRLMDQLFYLGTIGYEEGKGMIRMSYSEDFVRGTDYVKGLMEEAGLSVTTDAVGNVYGTMTGSDPSAKIIAFGSHLDSVPGGGIYDGPVGVLSAVEAVRTMKENGYVPNHPLQVISFIEEEGNVIGGLFGSRCACGHVPDAADLINMEKYGLTMADVESSRIDPSKYQCFMEVHIEQSQNLELSGTEIGVVGGIVGIVRYKAVVSGFANHAGTTPMRLRDDALEKACGIITDLLERVRTTGNTMVGTVGVLNIKPGAANVIPGEVEFIIELRDRGMEAMYRLAEELERDYADRGLTLTKILEQKNVPCDPQAVAAMESACEELGLSHMDLYSGAGHDMMNMGRLMAGGMIFIPSKDGISHRAEEYSKPEDIVNGANVLLRTILKLDQNEENE